MTTKSVLLLALAACGLWLEAVSAKAQGTAFTYQGRLNDGGSAATGSYDLQFSIYDAASAGNLQAGPLTNLATGVSNGLFTVSLDFGAGVFSGAPLWLEIDARTNGAAAFTTLSPRQALAASPYAIMAGNVASGGLTTGTYSNAVNFNNGANEYTGTYTGSGAGLTNVAGALPSQAVAGTMIQAVPNASYALTNTGLVSVTLPVAPNVGDVVRFAYSGSSSWQLLQNPGQIIIGNNLVGTAGSWTQLLTNAATHAWETIICSPDGTHVAAGPHSQPGLITSQNGGASWNFLENVSVSGNDNALCQSADGSTLIAAWSAGFGFTVLTNYGSNVAFNLPTNALMVAGATNLSHVVGATTNLIFTTVPPWTNWVPALAPNTNWSGLAVSADGSHCVATVDGGGIYTSTNFGTNWTLTPAPSNAWSCVASSANGNQLVAGVNNTGTNNIYMSANAGNTWIPLSATNLPAVISLACSADGTHLIAGNTGATTPNISIDSGLTWAPANIPQKDVWYAVGCSAGGNFFAAENQEGAIFGYQTATTTGAAGYLSGGPYTALELEYMGNGEFLPVSHEGTLFLH